MLQRVLLTEKHFYTTDKDKHLKQVVDVMDTDGEIVSKIHQRALYYKV